MTGQVKVLLHAMFKQTAGKGEVVHELGQGSTLRTLIDELARRYDKDFKQIVNPATGLIEADTLVMVNGQSMREPDVRLKDGDIVMITVPIGGG